MREIIRVLQVIGIMNRGGAETMIMNLYRRIDRNKVQFDFVENTDQKGIFDDEILALGGRIYYCPHYNGKNHTTYVHWWKELFKEHQQEYKVIHGHLGSTAAIYLSIAKKQGLYTIAHSHSAGTGSVMYQLFSYPTRFVADDFFACSREAGIVRYGKRIGKNLNRCKVLNNAIDLKMFSFDLNIRRELREKLGICEDEVVIGNIGRFDKQKNQMFLVDVFAEIQKINPKSWLLLIGDGVAHAQVAEKVREMKLQNKVIMTGVQSNVKDYYQIMDVFAMPSLCEGLPVTMVEAQAAGLQCCVSDTIPKEAALSELVEFRSLQEGPRAWAEWLNQSAKKPRHNVQEQLRSKGYDVQDTSIWLEQFYEDLVRKNEEADPIDGIYSSI